VALTDKTQEDKEHFMQKRLEKAKKKLSELGADALYVTSEINARYLTGFDFSDGSVLITKNESYVLTDFRYIEAAKKSITGGYNVIVPDRAKGDYLENLCRENDVKSLAFEDNVLSYAGYQYLKKRLPGIELVCAGSLIEDLRLYKDAEEVENIIAAQRIAEQAFAELLPEIRAGRTETELAAELEYRMKRLGAEDISFKTICVSGTASALPHGVPRNIPIERGFLTFDFGAVVNGYHSDMTRTVVVGRADDEMRRIYNTVLKAQLAAEAVIAEGYKNADADKVARDIIDEAGYKGCFGHSLGHGVGLMIHEAPGLHARAGDAVLEVGQIVTVEPGIYIEGKYGCRIEDMMEIIPGGARNLTNCPKELIEIPV